MVTTDADSSITTNGSSITTSAGTFAAVGIAAYAFDGGDASITNDGTVTAANGIALHSASHRRKGSGTVTITNDGSVSGDGTSANPVVQIITVTGAATLTYNAAEELRQFRRQLRASLFPRVAARSRSTTTAPSSATSRWPTRRSPTRAAAYGMYPG